MYIVYTYICKPYNGLFNIYCFSQVCEAALQMMKTATPEPHAPCLPDSIRQTQPCLPLLLRPTRWRSWPRGGKRRAFWDQVFREKEAVGFPGGRAWTTVGLRRESHTLAPAPAPLLWFESNKQMWKILEQGRAG